jgi:alanyl-tRNA synthetase
MEGFRSALEKQKDRSRNATKTSFGDWTVVSEDANSNFIGYDQLSCTTKVAKVRKAVVKGKETGQIVLMETPFYAESGGQVGDKGVLTIGEEIINVYDTKKENGEIIHYTDKIPKALRGEVKAEVSARLRNETKKNHTATHFLHHALRAVLGKHVEQKGSLVAPDRLRFDFSHYEKVSDEQLTLIERQVRHMISEDLDADIREMDIDAAKEAGAMALFGEKYGNRVRVVKFGPSIELCGGTHVENSSIVGGFKLLSESSVASGVRRVEALTGESYQAYVDQQLTLLDQVAQELGRPKDLLAAVEKLQLELKQTQKQLQDSHEKEKGQLKHSLQAKLRKASSYQWLIETLEGIDPKSAKDTVYSLTLDYPDLLALVMGHFEEKPYIIVGISKALAESGLFDAVKIIRILAPDIDGGGGGQRFLAMAGGKNKQGLQRALEHANEIIEHQAAS